MEPQTINTSHTKS